jgi:hypothetical protein
MEHAVKVLPTCDDSILFQIQTREFWLLNERSGGEIWIDETYWVSVTGHVSLAKGYYGAWKAGFEELKQICDECPWPLLQAWGGEMVVETYSFRCEGR